MKSISIYKKSELIALRLLSAIYEFFSNRLIKVKIYPKNYHEISDGTLEFSDYAIVIQGQFVVSSNFTWNTVLIYLKIYPNITIVISCWEEDKLQIKDFMLEMKNVHFIFNRKPHFYGLSNINLQIVSSVEGIKKAKALNIKFVAKTRTDQRFFRFNLFHHCKSLMEIYEKNIDQTNNRKLIISSYNTFKYRLYGVSDMFMFGYIDDMMLYWDSELDDRKVLNTKQNMTKKEFAMLRSSEVYLCTNYLKKIDHEINWELDDYWYILSRYFIVLNKEDCQMYWLKYEKYLEDRFMIAGKNTNTLEFGFLDWIQKYNNRLQPSEIDYQFLNSEFISEYCNKGGKK